MPGQADALSLSLVRGDALFRVQRALGLIPAEGLGIARRAVFFTLLAWLPIVLWAVWRGRAIAGGLDEPLLAHFGVHVRCLIAIPLLIIAEGVASSITSRVLPQFVRAGLVADAAALENVVRSVARLRDRTLPWVIIAGLVIALTVLGTHTHQSHELMWAAETPERRELGFGGWWYAYVVRPFFVMLVLAWLWRVVLLFVSLRRFARLPLSLVPTHPDRLAGLGFIESLPSAFSLVVLALASVLASGWAHDVVYHGATLESLRLPAAGFLVLVVTIFLAPMAAFVPLLLRTKRQAALEYDALVAAHG